MWYEHLGHDDGFFRWTANEAKGHRRVGDAKQTFFAAQRLFSGGHGNAIYALMDDGDLLVVRYLEVAASSSGTAEEGRKIGHAWDVQHVFSAGDGGVIYAITPSGNSSAVPPRRPVGRPVLWLSDVGRKVGHGWAVKQTFST